MSPGPALHLSCLNKHLAGKTALSQYVFHHISLTYHNCQHGAHFHLYGISFKRGESEVHSADINSLAVQLLWLSP